MTHLPITIRRFKPDDVEAMLRFARGLPEHDLLFLGRDLKHRKVVEAWLEAVEDGFIDSFVARRAALLEEMAPAVQAARPETSPDTRPVETSA